MAYFLAPSLVALRNEINAAHPNRDKTSDGWIGDASHAARASDHNPDYAAGGIVRAIDVDKDGIDTAKLLAVATRDPRVEYVIWQRGIYERVNGFRRRAYTGINPHDKHMHISIRHTVAGAAGGGWGYSAGAPAPAPAPGGAPWGSGKPVDVVAREVINNEWGVGQDRINRLRAALYDPAVIQNAVNAILRGGTPAPPPPPPARKSIADIATEVLRGEWGNNPQRGQRLLEAGYNPTEVQNEVNRRVGGAAPAPVRLSISVLADQVIKNQWGNGLDRERRITAAGYDYAAVRAEVNRRLA